MQTEKNKKIGLLILCLATLGFFFCIFYFNQSGSLIEYRDRTYMIKMIITYAFIPIGLYFGLLFTSGKKLATMIGGGMTLLLIIGLILGVILH